MDDQPKKKYSRWERGEAHHIEITPRVLDILHKLFIHGALSSAMLNQLVAPKVKINDFRPRLKFMHYQPNVLIDRPPHQKAGYNANYRPLVYSISSKGIQVLKDFGRISDEEIKWRDRMSFKTDAHDMMATYCTASIELGANQNGARFIPWAEILGRTKCPQETKDAKRPLEIKVDNTVIIPDAIFGIENDGFQFFALEADRQTESIESVKRSSFAGKIALYKKIFQQDLYKKHFGIPNMLMLTVTISDIHERKIREYVERTYASGTKPFCFKAIPSLNPYINNPPATGHLFTEPWKRVRFDDFVMGKE